MSSSSVPQEALPLAVGTTYLGFLSQLPPELVLGSFTGAVIFLLGVTSKPKWMWMLLFSIAFMTGLLGGSSVSAVVGGALALIRIQVEVPLGMGAMASAACTVNFVGWIRDNPMFFFRRGNDKGDAA